MINPVTGKSFNPEFNVSEVRAMTDEEVKQRAAEDCDAPIVNPKNLKQVKRIKN